MRKYYVLIGLLFSIATYGQQTIVFQETFEEPTSGTYVNQFTPSEDCADGFDSNGILTGNLGYDYFTRTTSGRGHAGDDDSGTGPVIDGGGPGTRIQDRNIYKNPEGSYFWAAQDINGCGENRDTETLEKTGIDISGRTNLSLVLLAAEDDADFDDTGFPKEENWDNDTHVYVEIKIDGGAYTKVLQFSAGADGSSDNNMEPKLDTNLDGMGDGTVITNIFQEFSVNLASLNIPSTATTLDLKITFDKLGAGGEDFAIDNIRIVQNYATPEAPVISGGATASINVPENTTAVTTVTAADANGDTISYDIDTASPDAGKFTITTKADGTGADLTFTNAPDYETPASSNNSNSYMVVIRVDSGTGTALCCKTQAITVNVTDVDESPVITSNGGGATASVNVAENTVAVTTVVATDSDGDTITYNIDASSLDASKFTITTRADGTGADLTFTNEPDYETPASSNNSNTYMVVVRVNSSTLSDTQTITVTVTDDTSDNISVQQEIVFQETFETGSVFTASEDCYDNPPGYDYFTRTTSGEGGPNGANGTRIRNKNVYLNPEGSYFWAAQDINGCGENRDTETLEKTGIDISGRTNLSLVLLVAEDDEDTPTNQKWDNNTHVFFEVKVAGVNGGAYTKVLQFSAGADGSSNNDMEPKLDTNLDGTGDGTAVTDTFQEFSVSIDLTGATGTTLDLKITFEKLDAGGEDFAIDNIRIIQDFASATSSDASLSSLVLSEGTLDPSFTSGTFSYNVNVANSVANLTVTPTISDSGANVTVNSTLVTSGDASTDITLSVGDNIINIVVTAEDGTTTQTYTVTVTRATVSTLDALTQVWAYTLPGELNHSSPAISDDSTVFIGFTEADRTNKGANFIAIKNGAKVWDKNIPESDSKSDDIRSSPSIAADGSIYMASFYSRKIFHLNSATGNIEGEYNTDARIRYSCPVFAADGTVYVGGYSKGGKGFYSLTSSLGSSNWVYKSGSDFNSTPAIGADGTIYVSSTDDYVYAINPDGTEKWSAEYGIWSATAIAIGPNGTVYFAGETDTGGVLIAYDTTNGTENWRKVLPMKVTHGGPAIAADGTIYLGGYEGKLIAYNPTDGSVKWEYTADGAIEVAPAIDNDGNLYFGDLAGFFHVVDTDGQAIRTKVDLGDKIDSSAAIGSDGTIYVAAHESGSVGKVYAFSTDATGLQVGGWPMFAKNAKHSGRFTTPATTASSDATLSSLVLSEGMLDPSFTSGTLIYNTNVTNSVANLTVTPTISDSGANVMVNSTLVTSGDASTDIALSVGDNIINIVVTAEDGTTMQTYTVTVTRAAPAASSDASLSNLVLSEGMLDPSFTSSTLIYNANVTNTVTSLTVTPTISDSGANVMVNSTLVTSGDASTDITLSVGDNIINIVVTAEDGTTMQTYTVTVTRAAPAASSDASLSNLVLSEGMLDPSFTSSTLIYNANVTNTVTSLTVTPTISDSGANVMVNSTLVTSGDASTDITLSVGDNIINIVVTAEDGTTMQTYTVTVTRAAPAASSDASLSNLVLSEGMLDPSFTSSTLIYNANVTNTVTSLTVTPTISDSGANVMVNSTLVTSGDASTDIALSVGDNIINIVVTTEDGTTTQLYTVTVTRETPATPPKIISRTVSLTGETITMQTNKPVTLTNVDNVDFSVTSNLNGNTIIHGVTSISLGSIILTVDPAIPTGATVSISYDPTQGSSTDAITDNAGTPMLPIDNITLSNNDFEITGFAISPNPTADILNITVTKKANYSLLNIRGQILKKGVLTAGESKINLSSFAKGIYFLNIKTSKGSFTKKIVKN